MLSLTFIIVFIFCLAFATTGILVGHQFITTYNTDFHRNYFYYLAMYYAFAFYGIWGQILVRIMLAASTTSVEIIEAMANFLPVLGVPFLFISWIMLIKMAYTLFDVKVKISWIVIHFVLLAILISGVWIAYTYLNQDSQLVDENLKYFEIGILLSIEFIYFLVFMMIVVYYLKKQQKPIDKYIYRFLYLMMAGILMRGCILPLSFINPWIQPLVILLYFASNLPPLFYLKINSDLIFKPIHAENTNKEKMGLIFKRYHISKREKEIVQQICEGKTNQQIADELFISLQTVKDHTHRIYSKIGINSRMKLVQLVNN